MNDLRRWFNQWELSTDPALCGINWRSPVDGSNPVTNTQNQFNSGAGFGSALVLSHSGTPPQGESAAESAISWIVNSRRCSASGTTSANEAVIVRLFYPKQQTLPASASDLAGMWHNVIQYCQGVGVYNFVVLNEPDLEYSGQLWNPTNPQYMSDLSDALRSQNPGTLYLGFPSPSAEFGDPSSSQWQQYWGDYGNVISMKYNNLAVHVYGSDMSALQTRVSQRLPDLRGRFPNLPQRLTEYGVPITAYGGDHGARGSDYGSFIKNFMRTSTYSYVLACHAFIARDSPDFGTSTSQQYEMTDTEVANLVGVVGCVGQTG